MTPERWEQVCKIFDAAAALQPEQRSSFLDQACGQDEPLRREVQSLLGLHGPTGDFLDAKPMEHFARVLADENAPSLSGHRLGRYELISLIGAGGMGEVYRARDQCSVGSFELLRAGPSDAVRPPRGCRNS